MLERLPQFNNAQEQNANIEVRIERVLDSIDEAVLEDLYSELLRRSGVEEKKVLFIPLSEVRIVRDQSRFTSGTYFSTDHHIEINTAFMKEDMTDEELATAVVKTLIHEEVHAISKSEMTFDDTEFTVDDKVGFSVETRDEITQEVVKKAYTLFNEGMTELITDDVFESYIQRTGRRNEFIKDVDSTFNSQVHTYQNGRIEVTTSMQEIAGELGVSPDTVFESFVRLYFEGKGLASIQADMKENLGFSMKVYENMTTEESVERLKGIPVETLMHFLKNYTKRSLIQK